MKKGGIKKVTDFFPGLLDLQPFFRVSLDMKYLTFLIFPIIIIDYCININGVIAVSIAWKHGGT
jgi:hypothetical protein